MKIQLLVAAFALCMTPAVYCGDFDSIPQERLGEVFLGMAPATVGTELIRAAIACDVDRVKLLAEKVEVNALDEKTGTRALNGSAYSGCVEAARFLIEEKHADVNLADLMGWTPLMTASYRCSPDLAQLLVSKGALLDVKDRSGETAASLCEKAARGDRSGACAQTSKLLRAE